jgi:hypothetical protein
MSKAFKNWFKKQSMPKEERAGRFSEAINRLLKENDSTITCDVKVTGPKDKEKYVQKRWNKLMEEYGVQVLGQVVIVPKEDLTPPTKTLAENEQSDTIEVVEKTQEKP